MVATNNPMAVNDKASPAASATGPNRSAEDAAPSTMGRIGRTHGDKIDSTPARKARNMLPEVIGSDRLERLCRASAAIDARFESPTDRLARSCR